MPQPGMIGTHKDKSMGISEHSAHLSENTFDPKAPESWQIRRLIDNAISHGMGSAASCVFSRPDQNLAFTTGRLWIGNDAGYIDETTLFDLASLTKPMVTAAIAMAMVSEGLAALDQPIDSRHSAPTLGQLLTHSAGFPAHIRFFRDVWKTGMPRTASQFDSARDQILQRAKDIDPVYAPGSQSIYSDLGYMILGDFLERVGGMRLDALFAKYVADPLELPSARFIDLRQPQRPAAVATEQCPTRGLVCGEVHDENCHVAGGIMGHAGLFGTAIDVSTFAAAMIDALHAAPMQRIGRFRADVVQTFFSKLHSPPNSSWRMGWDTPSTVPGLSHAGDTWSRHGGFGHLGFTGTSLWLDVPRRGFVVLLTNRVHPRREPSAATIKQLRRDVGDAAAAWLQGEVAPTQ
jgi:serine-type D-Ala-D-Ala carboxypeptidase